MNDALPPLDPDELDELLSADLDGELEAAARDRGSDVDTIRARIAATPAASGRRAQLTAARDALAASPELDELVEARLRAKALRAAAAAGASGNEARRARHKRVLLSVSGIAAAILVVGAIAIAVERSGSSSTSNATSAAAPPSARHIDLTKPIPALGSYSDKRALGAVAVNVARQRPPAPKEDHNADGSLSDAPAAVQLQHPASSRRSGSPANAAFGSNTGSGTGTHSASTTRPPATKSATSGGVPSCMPAKFAGAGDQLLMSATATLNGRPVRVYVFVGNGEHTVVVLGASCALVNVQTFN